MAFKLLESLEIRLRSLQMIGTLRDSETDWNWTIRLDPWSSATPDTQTLEFIIYRYSATEEEPPVERSSLSEYMVSLLNINIFTNVGILMQKRTFIKSRHFLLSLQFITIQKSRLLWLVSWPNLLGLGYQVCWKCHNLTIINELSSQKASWCAVNTTASTVSCCVFYFVRVTLWVQTHFSTHSIYDL